jgi:hypothetical protein
MRLLILCAAIALPASSTAAPPPAPEKAQATASSTKPTCASANVQLADSPPKLEARRLDQLPSANLTLAVVREVEGCHEPVVVRYGYGAGFGAPSTGDAEPPRMPPARVYR